jgi:hypothetical protein
VRTLYRDDSVLVTDVLFKTRGQRPTSVAIAELDHLYVVRVRASGGRAALTRIWPVLLSIVTAAVIVAFALRDAMWEQLVLPTAALVLAGALLIFHPQRGCVTNELWAVTGRDHLCLYRSTDARIFEQVRRAVIRAREHTRP